MKAKVGTRFSPEGRTKLHEVIPLDTPFLLFIDPSSACNFKCVFCACGLANKANWSEQKRTSVMSYELYRKIIDDACFFPNRIKTLRLYKEGEPLLNKRLPDMISYARNRNVAEKIDFTTNAALLTPDLSLAIIDAGLDRINISVQALDEFGYKNNSGAVIDFKKFVSSIEYLYKHKQNCNIFIKISDFGLGDNTTEEFYKIFGDICDEISLEYITPVWPNHDVSNIKYEFASGIYGQEALNVDCCPYIFYSVCVNSDGSVSACLMDWNHELIVGDAHNDSIVDIWNSGLMNDMRINHLKSDRKRYGTCANCGQLTYGALDSIDSYKDVILRRLMVK